MGEQRLSSNAEGHDWYEDINQRYPLDSIDRREIKSVFNGLQEIGTQNLFFFFILYIFQSREWFPYCKKWCTISLFENKLKYQLRKLESGYFRE